MNLNEILVLVKDWFLTSGIRIFLIILLTAGIMRIFRKLARRFTRFFVKKRDREDLNKRAKTLSSVIRNALNIVVGAVALMMILDQVGVKIGPIMAAAGIVGVAVGFAGQSLVKDIINGFFILLEDQIRVGDYVKIADLSGTVERINLKLTVLRDLEGNVHFIPNGEVTTVTNKTRDFSRYMLDIGVAYREDVDEVIAVMRRVDEEIRREDPYAQDILEPIEIMGLDRFEDSAVVIRARLTTKPGRQWAMGREFKRRLKITFDEQDIEIPFPHTTLYLGQDKDKTAAPLMVSMERNR